jgi:hypothetical protein
MEGRDYDCGKYALVFLVEREVGRYRYTAMWEELTTKGTKAHE